MNQLASSNKFIEFTEIIPERADMTRKRSFNVAFITGVIDRNGGNTCTISDNGFYVVVQESYEEAIKKIEKAWKDG